MFHCQLGNHSTKENEKLIKVIVEKKDKEYPETKRLWRGRTIYDRGGKGFETVREVNSCALHSIGV